MVNAFAGRGRNGGVFLPCTTPTTGVDHWPIAISGRREVLVKEIGGAVMALWPKYLTANVCGVVVFLDASNRAAVSATVMELHGVLQHADAQVRVQPQCM